MSVSVLMPALSPTMTDGTLARWLVKEGDSVKSGDVIAEIETDKATMEVEALDDGVVAKLAIAEGTKNVAVNALIAVLAEEGENVDGAIAAVDYSADATQKTSSASPEEQPATTVQPEFSASTSVETTPLENSTQPKVAATQHMKSPSLEKPAQPVTAQMPSADGASSQKRIFASPLARRIAAKAGVDLAKLKGSGPHDRIIRIDVEDYLAADSTAQESVTVPMTATQAEERFVPHNAMRRVIAERLQHSKQTAPHFYLTVDCNIEALLAARKALNEATDNDIKISVNDMVVKAAATALMAEPNVNGCFEAEGCRYFSTADICVAVAVDGGLVTPVIHNAQALGLTDISRKTADLANRARAGKLDPSEYTGGSFTISNLGMYGIREFTAVINPPQAAILAVGVGEQRPVVEDGELTVATMMTVTLSADHRIVDGALGARWLTAFKRAIELPVTMLL